MKYLNIGDVHMTKDLVEEGKAFIRWVVGVCKEHDAIPLFLGDLYHLHGIVHVEVLQFWLWAFNYIWSELENKAVVVPGNHDCNHACTHTVLMAHAEQMVMPWHTSLSISSAEHKIACVKFYRDNDEFIDKVMSLYNDGFRLIICHQEFNGAQYESGFYAPGGVDPKIFPSDLVFFSGHIHKRQALLPEKVEGKVEGATVFYAGSVRQLRVDEVGVVKFVTLMDTAATPHVVFTDIEIPETTFQPFIKYKITEKNKKEIKNIVDSPRSIVEVEGTEEFTRKMLAKIPPSAKTKRTVTDQPRVVEVKESAGVPKAFQMFVDAYIKEHPEYRDSIGEVMEKIFGKCPTLKEGKELVI